MNPTTLRTFDLILSSLGLLFSSPIMLLILILGLLDTGYPIFRQERLGRKKVLFTLIKFRTMSLNTPSIGTQFVNADALTTYGKFLRRTKLDELPQLWNVLKGDMSLVGPRPGLPNQFELSVARDKLRVFEVRPGITGLAQISGVDMSTPELLAKIDAKMITNMSFRSYFRYLFLTILGKGQGDRIKGN